MAILPQCAGAPTKQRGQGSLLANPHGIQWPTLEAGKASPCKVLSPKSDPWLGQVFVAPEIFPTILRPRSTVVAARSGWGKSALAYMARQALAATSLCVELVPNDDSLIQDQWNAVIHHIVRETWQRISDHPDLIMRLGARAPAIKYFAVRVMSAEFVDYDLGRMLEDHSGSADLVSAIGDFRHSPVQQLFGPSPFLQQQISVLLDAVSRIGFESTVIWIDLSCDRSDASLDFVRKLFDSVNEMRNGRLHVKAFIADTDVGILQHVRGIRTLSADLVNLDWDPDGLGQIVDRRLQLASGGAINTLEQLVPRGWAEQFLRDVSDVQSPAEWISLAGAVLECKKKLGEFPPAEGQLVSIAQAYARERLPLWMDADGMFWRGKRKIEALTPKKRAIYPLVKYLFEHPGYHQGYRLTQALDMEPGSLDITVSRARHNFLENILPDGRPEEWVYLVTDTGGRGLTLLNTDPSRRR